MQGGQGLRKTNEDSQLTKIGRRSLHNLPERTCVGAQGPSAESLTCLVLLSGSPAGVAVDLVILLNNTPLQRRR